MITYPGSAQRQFDWDCLNRMTGKRNGATVQATYAYRADGMRTYKNTNNVTTAYRYDGQMGMEDVDTAGSTVTTTDYGIGARGIDWIQKTVGNGTPTVVFPIYDAHGNMVGDIQRGASGSYTVNDERTYDAWGSIRAGAQQNDPKGRYCASLGHKADDETGFIYMRARSYEPSTARFLSEDVSRVGFNYYSYCKQNPVGFWDSTGRFPADEIEGPLRELLGKKLISSEFFKAFMDRATEVRSEIHQLIRALGYRGTNSMPTEDLKELLQEQSLEYDSGLKLESVEDMASDYAAGEDADLLLLEEEVLIVEETPH